MVLYRYPAGDILWYVRSLNTIAITTGCIYISC